jgi:CDP-6-deoxy-D-xylo-4-hexulose-3-dehydrase
MRRKSSLKELMAAVRQFYKSSLTKSVFEPGQTYLSASGKVVGLEELEFLVEAATDLWLTTGRFAERFEKEFASWLDRKYCLLCNSGSSANLIALMALTSSMLGEKALNPGDEVITLAAGFPTTVNPILQAGLIPVYVDINKYTLNIEPNLLKLALGPKTRAIMLAHTLGNPFDLDQVCSLVKERGLWLIEDNCDATGSLWKKKKTGTFGHLSTFSFYPAHHITTGEGGAVTTDDPLLKRIAESFRDWGRDCWCPPGCDNSCGKRFESHMGDLPLGYDHKYIYRHIGYNLKGTDFTAALGLAQLPKLDGFIKKRRYNFERLLHGLSPCAGQLSLPQATLNSVPSWFGFSLGIKKKSKFSRRELIKHLESFGIGTRLLFGGNLLKQPAYLGTTYRLPGLLVNTDWAMENIFWIGLWPGLTEEMIDYIIKTINNFCLSKR